MFQGHDAILVNVLGNGVNMMGQWEYDEYGYGLGNVLNAYLIFIWLVVSNSRGLYTYQQVRPCPADRRAFRSPCCAMDRHGSC